MKRLKSRKSDAARGKKKQQERPVRTTLTPYQVERLSRISHEYVPDLPDYTALPDQLVLGSGLIDSEASGLFTDTDILVGKKSKSTATKAAAKASPQQVYQEVQKALGSRVLATHSGNLVLGELNFEFLNGHKAKHFAQAYGIIVSRFHLIFGAELDFTGMQTLGKANGYGYFVSTANSRNQAVGFLVHPRLKVLQKIEYTSVSNVQGIPNLRPAYALELQDITSGYEFWAVVVHLKSMRGGPKATAPVRHQQCQKLVQALQGKKPVIIGGDFNAFLNNTTDTQPLTQAGYKLLNPGDSTSTQSMGGRLDGFFFRDLGKGRKLGRYQVWNGWKNKAIGRTLTDHGLLSCRLYLCNLLPADKSDPECSGSGDSASDATASGDETSADLSTLVPRIVIDTTPMERSAGLMGPSPKLCVTAADGAT